MTPGDQILIDVYVPYAAEVGMTPDQALEAAIAMDTAAADNLEYDALSVKTNEILEYIDANPGSPGPLSLMMLDDLAII